MVSELESLLMVNLTSRMAVELYTEGGKGGYGARFTAGGKAVTQFTTHPPPPPPPLTDLIVVKIRKAQIKFTMTYQIITR